MKTIITSGLTGTGFVLLLCIGWFIRVIIGLKKHNAAIDLSGWWAITGTAPFMVLALAVFVAGCMVPLVFSPKGW